MKTNLFPKTYVVTGATAGIGLATAEALASRGASVIGVGRSAERCRQAVLRLRRICPGAQIEYLVADLSVQRQVGELAAGIHAVLDAQGKTSLEGLVNNAGTFTYWLTLTPDGIEMQWAVNHLAAFLLTHHLLRHLQAAPWARVVTVSSGSHFGARFNWSDLQLRRRYNGLRAYGNTKLANILFTLELNRRLAAQSSVRAFAADPGLVKTDIGLKGTPPFAGWLWKWRHSAGILPQEAAKGIVFLLTEPSLQRAAHLYWKHGHPKHPSREALDPQAASRLWALSEKMCGLSAEVQYASA